MLSRVAESIYWMNRYIERAENYARFIDVNLHITMDRPPGMPEQWQPLVKTTGDDALFTELYGEQYQAEDVIRFLTFDTRNWNSILSCLTQARENGRGVREIISSEMWMQINELYLLLQEKVKGIESRQESLSDFFRHIKLGSHLYNGIMDSTLSRTESWHWGNIGRLIERADKTARVIDMKYFYILPSVQDVGSPVDMIHWGALLRSTSGFEMYRKFRGKLDVVKIIDFLVFDRDFPRSIYFCLAEMEKSLNAIGSRDVPGFSNPAEKELGKIKSRLTYMDAQDIFETGLHEFMDDFQLQLIHLGNAVYQAYFARC